MIEVNFIRNENNYHKKGDMAIIIPPKSLEVPGAIQVFPRSPAPDRWTLVSICQVAKVMWEEGDENFISNICECELFAEEDKIEILNGILIFKPSGGLLILNFEEHPGPFLREAHKFFTRNVRLDVP